MNCSRRRGLTLVELVIVIVLIGLALRSAAMVSDTTSSAVTTNTMAVDLETRGHRAMQQIKTILRTARVLTVGPIVGSPFSRDFIEFQREIGLVGTTPVLSTLERIELQLAPGEADDGADNNGNGLVDDCRIVWIQDVGGPNEKSTVIAKRIPELLEGEISNVSDDNGNELRDEPGLCFDHEDGLVNVRLTVERANVEGLRLQRTFETAILFRN